MEATSVLRRSRQHQNSRSLLLKRVHILGIFSTESPRDFFLPLNIITSKLAVSCLIIVGLVMVDWWKE